MRVIGVVLLLRLVQVVAMDTAFPFGGHEYHALLQNVGGWEAAMLRVWTFDTSWLAFACFLLMVCGLRLPYEGVGLVGALLGGLHWIGLARLVPVRLPEWGLLMLPVLAMQAVIVFAAWIGWRANGWWHEWWQEWFPPRARTCPACGSGRVQGVIYGYPSRWISRLVESGQARHAGCVVTTDSPTAGCLDCRHEWRDSARELPIDGSP